jgi:hypothetical protein
LKLLNLVKKPFTGNESPLPSLTINEAGLKCCFFNALPSGLTKQFRFYAAMQHGIPLALAAIKARFAARSTRRQADGTYQVAQCRYVLCCLCVRERNDFGVHPLR